MSIWDLIKSKTYALVLSREQNQEDSNEYTYILFSEDVEDAEEYMHPISYDNTDDYYHVLYDEYYPAKKQLQYVLSCIKKMNSTVKAKTFFETLERLDKLLPECKEHTKFYKLFKYDLEYPYYIENQYLLINRFLNKSFRNNFREALELQTAKGRIDRVDHWFIVMEYYSQFFPPQSVNELTRIKDKWNTELNKTLLE